MCMSMLAQMCVQAWAYVHVRACEKKTQTNKKERRESLDRGMGQESGKEEGGGGGGGR